MRAILYFLKQTAILFRIKDSIKITGIPKRYKKYDPEFSILFRP